MVDKSLSIAHLHWGFPPTIGGVETHMAILLPDLKRMGHKQWVLTASLPDSCDYDTYEGVEIFRTPVMDLNRLLKPDSTITREEVEREFKTFLDRVQPDIIHAHNMHYFTRIHAEVLSKEAQKRRIPLILTAHNAWDEPIFLDLTAKFPWSHIIAVSHFIKRELTGAGFSHKKVTVVHHGIDTDKFNNRINTENLYEKYPNLRNKKIIFHPARISLGKGSDIAIKALRIVKKRFGNAFLILAGSGNIIDWDDHMDGDMAFMSELVTILGLKDNIYIDSFSIDQMAELYNLADVCVYPSSAQEPFGLTMLEAQATKKPMVVTRSGGMPEIIHDGINGYVVPIRDHEALAIRIITLLEDKKLSTKIGETGRSAVCRDFTRDVMARATLNVYRKVLAEKFVIPSFGENKDGKREVSVSVV